MCAFGRMGQCCIAAALFAALSVLTVCPLCGHADEPAIAASSDVITVQATPKGLNSGGWSATVTYAKPVAGAPTQFTITADGGANGSGSYQYQQGFIYKHDPYVWVFDPSFGTSMPYQDSNVLSYQFVGAGRYDYQFQVRDTQTNLYQRFTFTIDVEGEGFIDTDEKAREIVAECLPDGNVDDYETALVLHDWIIDNVSYDYTYRNLGVDRALAGMAVTCEGYHAAYVKLLEVAGMRTGRITDGGHVWTAVQMDGDWYHVDTTHDDVKDSLSDVTAPGTLSKEQQAHLLFGLDDATMMLANPSYKGPTQGYEATSLENNYFIKTGDILEWSDPIADEILRKLDQRETSFKVKASNASWPQSTYKNPINSLVAYELNRSGWTTDSQTSDAVVRVGYADDYFNVEAFAVLSGAPSVASGLVYTGNSQTGVAVPDAGKYVVSGTAKATNAGTYTATVAPAAGYAWDETGDRAARTYQWKIGPASLASGAVTAATAQASYEYAGGTVRPQVSVKHNGRLLKEGTDYTVSYANNAAIGKATATVRGNGKNYTGTRTISFSVVAPKSKWLTVGGKKYYYGANGQPVKWSQKIGGSWYYFNGSGIMQTGWVTWKDGTKSYFDWDGKALLGWRSFSGVKYYFDPATGISKRWSQRLGGYWYYFDSASRMKTGWVTWKDGRKSYFNWDGKALTGWRSFNGVKYYFDPITGMTR